MVLLCRFLVCPKETKQATFRSLCLPAFSEEKTAQLFLKGANLHTTKNTMVSQEGHDITLFLPNACEFYYDFPGY